MQKSEVFSLQFKGPPHCILYCNIALSRATCVFPDLSHLCCSLMRLFRWRYWFILPHVTLRMIPQPLSRRALASHSWVPQSHHSCKTSSEFSGALIADGPEWDCRHHYYFLIQHVFSHMAISHHPVLCCVNDLDQVGCDFSNLFSFLASSLALASPKNDISIGFVSEDINLCNQIRWRLKFF